jgi:stress responsive alpha/beta barrel protein
MKSFLVLLAALSMALSSASAADGPLRHMVAFKFKAGAEPAKIKAVEDAFAALKGKIDVIQHLEAGTDISADKRNKGFDHVWIVTFKDAKDRDTYINHPDHKAFAAMTKDVVEDVMVIDFVPKES